MNRVRLCILGALFPTALVFCQSKAGSEPVVQMGTVKWFSLEENKLQVEAKLGPPRLTAEFGNGFESWQYQIGNIDTHDYSHQLVFRRSDGKLVSVARNYEPEQLVDEFFPTAETAVYSYPNWEMPGYQLRLRHLSGGRVLIAMGSSKQGQPAGQLLLIHQSDVDWMYPWLSRQLEASKKPN